MKRFKRIISSILSACMMLSLVSVAYASDTYSTYEALFQAQKEIVNEINAEYGTELTITPQDGAEDADLSQINLNEFRAVLTAHAKEQQELNTLAEEMENAEDSSMSLRHGTFFTKKTYGRAFNVRWSGYGNFTLTAQISADVFKYNNMPHAHSAKHVSVKYVPKSSNIPGFIHSSSKCISVRVDDNNDKRSVIGMYSSDIGYNFMLAIVRESNCLSTTTFNIN